MKLKLNVETSWEVYMVGAGKMSGQNLDLIKTKYVHNTNFYATTCAHKKGRELK